MKKLIFACWLALLALLPPSTNAQIWSPVGVLPSVSIGAACPKGGRSGYVAGGSGQLAICDATTSKWVSVSTGGGAGTQAMLTNQAMACSVNIDGQVRFNTTTGTQQVCVSSVSAWRDLNGVQFVSDCATKATPGPCTSVTGQTMYYVGMVSGTASTARLVTSMASVYYMGQGLTWDGSMNYCRSLGAGWFLPHLFEMQAIAAARNNLGLNFPTGYLYWTSSGYDANSAYAVDTTIGGGGGVQLMNKYTNWYSFAVICARRD